MTNWKVIMFFFISCPAMTSQAFSQKILNEGTISYSISTESMDDKAATTKSLEGATLTVSIRGSQSRTDMVSALGTESSLYDTKTNKGTILKQYSGQKLMISLTPDNWSEKNKFYQNIRFTIENNEQMIAGFTCKKAVGKSSDGNTLIVYFTPEIILANKQYGNAFTELPGLPVQYELLSGKLKFKYLLNNVNFDPVPVAKFDIPKTGYRIITYDETQQLKKGGN